MGCDAEMEDLMTNLTHGCYDFRFWFWLGVREFALQRGILINDLVPNDMITSLLQCSRK